MLLTLDSSVIVASLRKQEPMHQECRRLLEQLRSGQHVAVQPLTVLIEVAAAVRRRTGSAALATRAHRDLLVLGSLQFVELDRLRADRAVEIATQTGIRGMDAIVVQVAEEFNSTLVSLDLEMVQRSHTLVAVRAVGEF